LLNNKEKQNVEKAKTEIKNLKLEKLGYYGLEEAFLIELDSLINDDAYLEDYAVLYPNNPYFPPSYQGQKGPQEVPSRYFYDRTRTMQNAYTYYITSDSISGVYQDLVPRGKIQWK
jgi:hypothetical protein